MNRLTSLLEPFGLGLDSASVLLFSRLVFCFVRVVTWLFWVCHFQYHWLHGRRVTEMTFGCHLWCFTLLCQSVCQSYESHFHASCFLYKTARWMHCASCCLCCHVIATQLSQLRYIRVHSRCWKSPRVAWQYSLVVCLALHSQASSGRKATNLRTLKISEIHESLSLTMGTLKSRSVHLPLLALDWQTSCWRTFSTRSWECITLVIASPAASLILWPVYV